MKHCYNYFFFLQDMTLSCDHYKVDGIGRYTSSIKNLTLKLTHHVLRNKCETTLLFEFCCPSLAINEKANNVVDVTKYEI